MPISRRKFLVRGGQCVLMFGMLPGLWACDGHTRKEEIKNAAYKDLVATIGRERTDILWYASFAPSSHNAQPWMVTIKSPEKWIISSVEERWLPEVDPENREMLLSIGAFLENMVTAAKAYGFGVKIRRNAVSAFDPELLRLELTSGERQEYPLQRLLERRTLRTGFKSETIDPQDLSAITGDEKGFSYYQPLSPEAVWLDEATIEANRQQVDRDNVQQELSRWIRWSNADARRYRNGLTPEAMDITGLAGWYVKNFYGPGDVMGKDFRRATVERVKQQISESGGWIVITSESGSPASIIETGRRFERMFLKAKDRSIGVHPMSQVLEEVPWSEEARKKLVLQKPPQFLLRVGYLRDYPLPVSLRMSLGEITEVKVR